MEEPSQKRIKLIVTPKSQATHHSEVLLRLNEDRPNSDAKKAALLPFFELQEEYQGLEIDDIMEELARTLTIRFEELPFPSDVVSHLNQKQWFIDLIENEEEEEEDDDETTEKCRSPFLPDHLSKGSESDEVQFQENRTMCFHLAQTQKHISYLMAQFDDSNQLNDLTTMLNQYLLKIFVELPLQPFALSESGTQPYVILFKYENEFYRYQVQNIRFGIIMACIRNVTTGKYEFQWSCPESLARPELEFLPLFYYEIAHDTIGIQRIKPRIERMKALWLAYTSCCTQLNLLSTIPCGYAIFYTRYMEEDEIIIEVAVVSREDPLCTMSLYELSRINFNDKDNLPEQIEDFTVTMYNVQAFFRWYRIQLNDALQKEDQAHIQSKLRRHGDIFRQAKDLGEL